MIKFYWYNEIFTAEYAVNFGSDVFLYDENYNLIHHIQNLTYRDADDVSLEGTWTDPSEIPTETDRLQASIDYLDMQAESLEASDEANRADIDYCLMMLDDGATDEQLNDTTTEEADTTLTDNQLDSPTTEEATDPLSDGDTTDEQLG